PAISDLHSPANPLPIRSGYDDRTRRTHLNSHLRLAKERAKLRAQAFAAARQQLNDRLDHLILETHSRDPDGLRIRRRIFWHCHELVVFRDDPQVPADNNRVEQDIRSLAAARSDGGTNRSAWGAPAFGDLKSALRTRQESGRSFFAYGVELVP